MRNLQLGFLIVLALGCGSSSADDEGGTDATTDSPSGNDSGKDSAVADTGADTGSNQDSGMDAGVDAAPDAPMGGQCMSANDCKLFSSYCAQNPCACVPLEKNQPNPTCMGMMVTCLIDPCKNKVPVCDGGMCGVGP